MVGLIIGSDRMAIVNNDYRIDVREIGPFTIFSSGEVQNYTGKVEGTFVSSQQDDEKVSMPISFDEIKGIIEGNLLK